MMREGGRSKEMQQRVNDHFNVGLKKEVTRILAVQRLLRKQN